MADVYVQAPVANDCTVCLEAFGSQPMNKDNFGPSCDDNESLPIKSPYGHDDAQQYTGQ